MGSAACFFSRSATYNVVHCSKVAECLAHSPLLSTLQLRQAADTKFHIMSTAMAGDGPKFVPYHYTPNVAAAVIFIILFATATGAHLFSMFRLRAWYYIPFIVGGLCAYPSLPSPGPAGC